MRFDPRALPDAALSFLTERHLASLTTFRSDGSAHVVPVGFTFDAVAGVARVITNDGTVKVRNAERVLDGRPGRGALCQIEGRFWLTLEGELRVSRGPAEVADAVERYAGRYRQPRVNPKRVVVLMTVDRVMGERLTLGLFARYATSQSLLNPGNLQPNEQLASRFRA